MVDGSAGKPIIAALWAQPCVRGDSLHLAWGRLQPKCMNLGSFSEFGQDQSNARQTRQSKTDQETRAWHV